MHIEILKRRRRKAILRNCVFTHTFDGEVEAAQSVSRKRIGSTLEYNSTWLVHLHDFSHNLTNKHTNNLAQTKILVVVITQYLNKSTYRFEDGFIGLIINTVSKWVVHCIVLSLSSPNVLHTLEASLNYCLHKH